VLQAAEWSTSQGFHCIEKCREGTRGDQPWPVYWCPAVDGIQTLHKPVTGDQSGRPAAHEENNEVSDEDKVVWDYCTPAPLATLQGEGEGEIVEAVVLPERVNRTKRQSGGGGGYNPGTNPATGTKISSSLPNIECDGECEKNLSGKYTCDVPGTEPSSFYCSPDHPFNRDQLTSHNKLWCIGDCIKSQGADFYQCKTLYGYDRCSPQGDRSSTGDLCTTGCEPNLDHHYQCDTAEDTTDTADTTEDTTEEHVKAMEDCGYWYSEDAKKKTLEYTVNDQVCASPCLEREGALVCDYVFWKWNEEKKEANLVMSLGSCDPEAGFNWKMVGIIIGCIVGGILIIGVIAMFVSKRQYTAASTREH